MAETPKVPACIGIILDGNRRWAKENGLPQFDGHHQGYKKMLECALWVRERGIKHLVVYAFSTENWSRSEEEISNIKKIAFTALERDRSFMKKERIRVVFIGDRGRLTDLSERMSRMEEETAHNDGLTIWVCLSYGSRAEITAAARAISRSNVEITEESLRKHFWSAEMPDPDLIIRTGGQKRLSNFLLWQAAYSELFFIDALWPDFSEVILDSVLEEFAVRRRNFGI